MLDIWLEISLTNCRPSTEPLSIVGVRSNKSKKPRAADSEDPICRVLSIHTTGQVKSQLDNLQGNNESQCFKGEYDKGENP
ncbi:unnamed protein product, partial [Rotaria magnacalcarata]